MSLGDMWDFEKFNLKGMWDKIRDDPERLFLGAADPIGGKLWGEILNEDYDPIINQWGGPTGSTFDKAAADGIDTGWSESSHDAARIIAGIYAANYFGGVAGGAMGGGASGGAAGGESALGSSLGSGSGQGLLGDIGTTNMGSGAGFNWTGDFGGGGGMGEGLNWGSGLGGSAGGGGAAAGGINWKDMLSNASGQKSSGGGYAQQNPYVNQPIYDNDEEQRKVRDLALELRKAQRENY